MSQCETGSVGDLCLLYPDTAGVQVYFNATCNKCCQAGGVLPLDFALTWGCEEGSVPIIYMSIASALFGIGALLAILNICMNLADNGGAGFVAMLALGLSLAGVADATMVYLNGRYSESATSTFWLTFLFLGWMSFAGHATRIYESAVAMYEKKKSKNKAQPDGWFLCFKMQGKVVEVPIPLNLILLMTLLVLETVTGYVLCRYALFASWKVFTYVFAALLLNEAIMMKMYFRRMQFVEFLVLFAGLAMSISNLLHVPSLNLSIELVFVLYAAWMLVFVQAIGMRCDGYKTVPSGGENASEKS